jgi:hypothetical protein
LQLYLPPPIAVQDAGLAATAEPIPTVVSATAAAAAPAPARLHVRGIRAPAARGLLTLDIEFPSSA